MPAQAFAQLNQAESHHTHDGNGRKQPRRTFQLEAFRPKPCLDRLMIFLNHPACGILQCTFARLREVSHLGIAQQDPFQPVRSVWSSDFPDTHGGAGDGGLTAPPISWTPGTVSYTHLRAHETPEH